MERSHRTPGGGPNDGTGCVNPLEDESGCDIGALAARSNANLGHEPDRIGDSLILSRHLTKEGTSATMSRNG